MLAQAVLQEQEIYVPETFGNQEFANQTTLHPVGLAVMALLGVLQVALPRRHALFPLFAMVCLVSPAQRIVVAGLDFDFTRLLILCGGIRIVTREEFHGLRLNILDKAILGWCCVSSLAYILQVGTVGAVINRLGGAYDTLGMYFVVRVLLKDLASYDRCATYLLWIAMPVFLAFVVEHFTQRNPFAFMGGVPEITRIREGRLRCTGPFAHPILAGCFWAAALALVIAQWWRVPRQRLLVALGGGCMVGIIGLTASSTPLLGAAIAFMGWAGYCLRDWTRAMRWGALFTLIALHMIMNKPVWHLLARMSVVGGSTGWHRYALVDRFIANFNEWWLVGVSSTAHWGRQMFDLTNQFVKEGVQGGLLALVLFVAALSLAFGGAGRLRKLAARHPYASKVAWGLGVCLLVHAGMFFAISISYSQQNLVIWFFNLGAVGSLAPWGRRVARAMPQPGNARAAELAGVQSS